jgi:hypothetical protein
MFNDEEVNNLYLGKPFDDGTKHLYGGFVDLITFDDEEALQLFLGLPMISKLMNVPCKAGE